MIDCSAAPGQIRVFTSPYHVRTRHGNSPIFAKEDHAFIIAVVGVENVTLGTIAECVYVVDSRANLCKIPTWWLVVNSYAILGT